MEGKETPMTIKTGDRLPDANLPWLGDSGPETVRLGELM